jgi:hypothetical protein
MALLSALAIPGMSLHVIHPLANPLYSDRISFKTEVVNVPLLSFRLVCYIKVRSGP